MFADGAAFVGLDALREPALLGATIARALDLREDGRQPARDLLIAHLRPRQMLLLLDNFEQIIPAAPLVAVLLAACPRLHLLLTSRAPLRVRAESEYALGTLGVPPLSDDAGSRPAMVDTLARYPAVQLFLQRARAVRPDTRLTPANAGAVAAICQRLDGLPLALELAAAQVRVFPPVALAERLARQLPFPAAGPADLPDRQRTLRATLDWSHDLLSGEERALFRRLAVFAGGWTLDAAEVVGADGETIAREEIIALLVRLVDQSLVQVEAGNESAAATGGWRYRLLEPVRQYAAGLLAHEPAGSGEAEAARRRHARHYLGLAEEGDAALIGPDQAQWLARLGAERDNLRVALGWLMEAEPVAGAQLAAALYRFWYYRSDVGEGRHWLEVALAQETALPAALRMRLLNGAGVLAMVAGDHARSAALLGEHLDLAQASDDRERIARAHHNLALALRRGGDYARAGAHQEEAVALRRALGDPLELGAALDMLGLIARRQGDTARARDCHAEALALLREVGAPYDLACCLANLGIAALDEGDDTQAAAAHRESLTIVWGLGYREGVAECLGDLAGIAARGGAPVQAARLFGAAEALREAIGAPLEPGLRDRHERLVAAARAALAPDEFAATWAAGRALSPAAAVAEALAASDAAR
ncbi:MAG: tetratricopeptide repeat protein [Thermomicrobiales bacterium]